ncbi:MAG: C-GCAxxG-C-C family protein [Anaerolineales bacterium]|nr:C-GCAxxG-C-C family protein [Anaerolineales bacterium]
MNDQTQIALSRFSQGFSCSQSVFSAFAGQFGIAEDLALKIASPFGGGVARQGEVCGAVTGALMVIALKHGMVTPEKKEEIYKVSQEFIRRFEEKHSSIVCRELVGYDIRISEEFQKARKKKVFDKNCPGLVKDAAEIVKLLIE